MVGRFFETQCIMVVESDDHSYGQLTSTRLVVWGTLITPIMHAHSAINERCVYKTMPVAK